MTRRCCCFDAKSGTFIAATFTLTVSAMQFLLIVSLYGGFGLQYVFSNADQEPYFTSLAMYVGLAIFDLIIIIISALTLNGNEKGQRMVLLLWMLALGIYVLFEAGVNITFFILTFGSNIELLELAGNPTVISLIIYWLVKIAVCIACMYAVGHRWADLDDDKEPMAIMKKRDRIEAPLSLPIDKKPKSQVKINQSGGDVIRVVNMNNPSDVYVPDEGRTVMYQPGTQMYTGVGVVGEGMYSAVPPSTVSGRVLSHPANTGGQYSLQI